MTRRPGSLDFCPMMRAFRCLAGGLAARVLSELASHDLRGDFAELPCAGFSDNPLGGEDCAESEAASVEGFVTQFDQVALAACGDDVDAADLADAVSGDVDLGFGMGFEQDVAEGERGAGGGIELGGVVGFGDGEAVLLESGKLCGELEEFLDAEREVGAVEQGSAFAVGEGFHVGQLVIPASGADDDARAECEARAHVFEGGLWVGEVNDNVDGGKRGRGKRASTGILFPVEDAYRVAAFASDLGD
uniref:Uncharacterized protein n=1 Tax=mine drainage metagenome TaxID=410659 RepID=E6QHL0_9ZZZZ